MLFIFNPVAGQGTIVENLFEVINRFVAGGFEVTIYPTGATRDAYRIAAERAQDFEYLVCAGGDGTLGEVVDALMTLPRKPMLGYIPCGSTNDFAATHGLETDVLLGAQSILNGTPTWIDVGAFQNDFFTYVAAFGLFTDVSYGTPQDLKNMFGHAAYILEGVKKLGSIKYHHCVINCDGEIIEGDFVMGLVLNSKSVGGFKLPADLNVDLSDGLFELILLRRVRRFAELQRVVGVLMGSERHSSAFEVRSVRHVQITCAQPLAWSVDGEFGGAHLETTISVNRKAIQMLTRTKTDEISQYLMTEG